MPQRFLTMDFDPELLASLHAAKHLVVFTGAGVSRESGIPTFREALTGLWSRFDPHQLATPDAFARDPALVWGWYEWRRTLIGRCQPNPAHRAIAALAEQVPRLTVITQNVDGLHQRAGSRDVLELHGSLEQPRCFACGASYPPSSPTAQSDAHPIPPPRCPGCGGPIRPGVVWFGEALPMDAWSTAEQAVSDCDLLFSVGTSSLVYPAAALPEAAAAQGTPVVQINPDPTPFDDQAGFNLRGPAGTILPGLLEAAWPGTIKLGR